MNSSNNVVALRQGHQNIAIFPCRFLANKRVNCPNKEAAPGSIVVSLPCTPYQCGSLIAFYDKRYSSYNLKLKGNMQMIAKAKAFAVI